MGKLIILFVIIVVVGIGIGVFFLSQKPVFLKPNAVVTLSKLRVSGNRIVTEEGQTIRLRGVNFTDPFLLEKDTSTEMV